MRILTFPDGYGDRAESLPLLLPPVSLPPYFSHPFPPVRYIMRERETDDVYISVCVCLRRTSMGGIWGFSQRESVNLCVLLFLCRLFILESSTEPCMATAEFHQLNTYTGDQASHYCWWDACVHGCVQGQKRP